MGKTSHRDEDKVNMKRKKRLVKIPSPKTDDGGLTIKIKTTEVSINMKSLNKMTEAEISNMVTTLLYKYGITPWQQQSIPSSGKGKKIGSCDLYIYDKRTIIEVKRVKRLDNGPHHPDSGDNGRSAFDQLEEYILAERSRQNSSITDYIKDDGIIRSFYWIGIVTNYKKWWAWTWPQHQSDDDAKLQDSFNGTELTPTKEKQLMVLLDRKDTKPVPEDLGPMFEPHMKRFNELYNTLRDHPDTETQRGLWYKQLEASGNTPDDNNIDEIFVRHTLLILVTRLISKATGGQESDILTQGFVSWVNSNGDEIKSLEADVNSYDWTHETRDIMRSLYMGFIPKEHRKSYGEYYTPDWLAEKLAMTVIDEKYVKEQLDLFLAEEPVKPVLDPACGSGSLLYHAGRLILNTDVVKNAREYMSTQKINRFLCSMLYGIDIHPVAVEMAKANIHRLIHYAPDQHIQVYQGDSLLLDRPTSNIHDPDAANAGDLILYSPMGTPLSIPCSFLKSPENIETLTRTAKNDIKAPKHIVKLLSNEDSKKVLLAHKTLTEIIKKEGNSVWEWYIKNQAAPLLLRERKAGRIISNPPWVRASEIKVESRQRLIETEARKLKLWVGGNTATSFDIAALFIEKCTSLYLDNPRKSAWVLMGGALKAKAWDGLRKNGKAVAWLQRYVGSW